MARRGPKDKGQDKTLPSSTVVPKALEVIEFSAKDAPPHQGICKMADPIVLLGHKALPWVLSNRPISGAPVIVETGFAEATPGGTTGGKPATICLN